MSPLMLVIRKASQLARPYQYFSERPDNWRTKASPHGHDASFEAALRNLFSSTIHPLMEPTFVDSDLNTWTYPNSTGWEPIWTAGLGKELCIFDMDDREYNETGQTWDIGPFSWDSMDQVASGPFNHYLYGKPFR